MPRVLRPVGHEDRLSVVDHLDELRSRLIVCAAALVVAFGLCFWQNQALLRVLNKPLPTSIKTEANHLSGLTTASGIESAAKALPQSTPRNVPITIGVGEPFTTTLTVCFYFAILFTLPVLL